MGVCASASKDDSLAALWDADALAKRSEPSARARDALQQLLGPGGLVVTLQGSNPPPAAAGSISPRRRGADALLVACKVIFKPAPACFLLRRIPPSGFSFLLRAACLVKNERKPSNAAVFLLSLSLSLFSLYIYIALSISSLSLLSLSLSL